MAKGRKADPAEVKEAKGNPSNRPTGAVSTDDLPVLAGGVPDELTATGGEIWRRMTSQLGAIRMLRESDRYALARYCDTLAQYWDVTRSLRDDDKGLVYDAETTKGGVLKRINPLFLIQDRLERRLVPLEDRFGLTPRSRQEIFYRLAQQPSAPELPLGSVPDAGDDPDPAAAGSIVGILNDGGSAIH